MADETFLKRISFNGNFTELLTRICKNYRIGDINSFRVIPIGYEDLNLRLETEKGIYFAKIFASFRTLQDCNRYISIIENALKAGVDHPKLIASSTGLFLGNVSIEESQVRFAFMEFVEGQTFYELGVKPTEEEGKTIIEQTTKINKMEYKPGFVYDSWSISHFISEFEKKKHTLEIDDKVRIELLVNQFVGIGPDLLPHSLVHGDIISTNVIRASDGKLYIIDFSVSNWNPRIQELAVLLCDLFFDPTNPESFMEKYNWAVSEYQKYITLTPEELRALPFFARAAHAMHVIGASSELAAGNSTLENKSWLALGRKGLILGNLLDS